ncbi:MAG: molybdopterin-dependent oxidoreductase, partial [Rhodobacteraceae bacterium]|nr:molybdopterin-dependent oxidoreductase [Paracoccaceae bacterium]
MNLFKTSQYDQAPSTIGKGIVDVLYSENRIYAPMVRKSWLEGGPGTNNHKRGNEPFYEVTWDQVETLVAEELKRVINKFGNEAIFGGTYGWASAGRFHHAPSQLKRFLNCLGGFTTRKDSYSLAAGEVVMPYVLGPFMKLLDQATSWSSISG